MEALIQVLESTIAARDPYTVGHQRRVSQIACTIGKKMGLPEDRLRDLWMAGLLHDLGKIAIPSDLLSKSGKLTTLEFALIKTHPQVAYNILEPIALPGKTALYILQHHERLNGSGYPLGLQGNDIFLESRILGVADVMEAMCSHRPYRPSLGLADAFEELSLHKGILYDPLVVEASLDLYGESQYLFSEESAQDCPISLPGALPGVTWVAGGPAPIIPLPQEGEKARGISRLLPKGYRSWMHLGTASLLGLLLMFFMKGF
jgi:HD-GYP domain-containing protein (c-di-GMP phosphodiesterase class II)